MFSPSVRSNTSQFHSNSGGDATLFPSCSTPSSPLPPPPYMPPIIPSAFPSTGRVPSPSIEIENSRMEETISPNTFTRPSCEREPRRKTISIWPSRKFHRCALYHELVSFRSVFFPFLSLSPYTLLFPTTTKREIAASTRTFKLAAIRFLSHGLHLLTPRVPRFFSLFLSSHFSFIFSANQEPTLDLGYGIRGVE